MDRRSFIAAGCAALAAAAARGAEPTAHDFAFVSIDGGPLRLADYAGRPILVVNTASFCAFTPQYDALQALWESRRDRGLVVLGVPTQDFDQEYGTSKEVREFCEVNFSIDFPMTDLAHVSGTDRHPFYAWAARELGEQNAPRWNFHKYLVDGGGELVAAFGSGVRPDAPELVEAVDRLLPGA